MLHVQKVNLVNLVRLKLPLTGLNSFVHMDQSDLTTGVTKAD